MQKQLYFANLLLTFIIINPISIFSLTEDPSTCVCGQPSDDDCGNPSPFGLDFSFVVESAVRAQELRENLRQCFRYAVPISNQRCANPTVEPQFRNANIQVDENRNFALSTPGFTSNPCYQPQLYCVSKTNCGSEFRSIRVRDETEIVQGISGLTKNVDASSCTDFVRLYGGQLQPELTDKLCAVDAVPPAVVEPLPTAAVDVHFFSSQRCRNRGNSLWLTCVPLELAPMGAVLSAGGPSGPVNVTTPTQKRIYKKLFIEAFNKRLFRQVRETIIVTEGTVLSYQGGTIILTVGNNTVQTIRGIQRLLVFDEESVCGNDYFSFRRSTRKTFGSGVLYIGYYSAWFVATTKELPIERRSSEEAAYIARTVAFLKPFYIDDPVEPTVPDGRKGKQFLPVCGRNRGTKAFFRPCPQRMCPSAEAQARALKEAKLFLKISDDFLVENFANLVIDTLTRGTRGAPRKKSQNDGLPPSGQRELECPVLLNFEAY